MMAPQEDLEQEYENLTDRQKAIVDARVENPDCPKTHISREYAPEIYNRDYADSEDDHKDEFNNSYVTQVLNGNNNELVPEIVDYLQDLQANQRFEGETMTEGDPFSHNPHMDSDDNSWQTWDERPTKQATHAAESAESPSETTDAPQSHPQGEQASDAQEPVHTAPVAVKEAGDGIVVKFDRRYLQELLESQELPPELHKRLVDEVLHIAFN